MKMLMEINSNLFSRYCSLSTPAIFRQREGFVGNPAGPGGFSGCRQMRPNAPLFSGMLDIQRVPRNKEMI